MFCKNTLGLVRLQGILNGQPGQLNSKPVLFSLCSAYGISQPWCNLGFVNYIYLSFLFPLHLALVPNFVYSVHSVFKI